jgi:uridine nucleosidase
LSLKKVSLAGGAAASVACCCLQALVELLLTFFATTYRDVFKFHDGAPLHDPCAVAAIIAPGMFKVGPVCCCFGKMIVDKL